MAHGRHKREAPARRKIPVPTLVAAPLSVLVTLSAVSVGALAGEQPGTSSAAQPATEIGARLSVIDRSTGVSRSGGRHASAAAVDAPSLADRTLMRSRAANLQQREALIERRRQLRIEAAATKAAVSAADTKLWTTEVLNVWSTAGADAVQLGELDAGKRVLVTGRSREGREEIVLDGESRWVTAGYLSADKPIAAAAGLSMAPCPDGSVESGLTDNAVRVYRAVCNAFPQITSYGGWDGHGEHASGRAIDIMTSDVALGTAIAEFLQAHAAELNLYDIIWRQHIWTQERSGEGWRPMSDRGSATANHYDHVHVATY